jgi:hypothetical protein
MWVVNLMIHFSPYLFHERANLNFRCVFGSAVRFYHVVHAGIHGVTGLGFNFQGIKEFSRFVVPCFCSWAFNDAILRFIKQIQKRLVNFPNLLSVNMKNSKKRYYCIGLRSAEISKYIQRTPAQFGGSRRVEIVACELFPNLFPKKFSRKKLNSKQKRQLNRTLFTESVWKIDRTSM